MVTCHWKVNCPRGKISCQVFVYDFEIFLAAAVMTGSACVVQCHNNKSNHRAGIFPSLKPCERTRNGKKDNVLTHTQCEFQPERRFDHFTDEFFQKAVHVAKISEVDYSIAHSNYMVKRTERKHYLREQDER